MKTFITNKNFYETNEELYDILSDYVLGLTVFLEKVEPNCAVGVDLEDCYLDDEGNFFTPKSYDWVYKGQSSMDDPDVYQPIYSDVPTLTKLEVQNLLVEVTDPELNQTNFF